jgi:hypothetical protein
MTNDIKVSRADLKGASSSMEEGRISNSSTIIVSTHNFLLEVITWTMRSRSWPVKPLFLNIVRTSSRSSSGKFSTSISSLDLSRLLKCYLCCIWCYTLRIQFPISCQGNFQLNLLL